MRKQPDHYVSRSSLSMGRFDDGMYAAIYVAVRSVPILYLMGVIAVIGLALLASYGLGDPWLLD